MPKPPAPAPAGAPGARPRGAGASGLLTGRHTMVWGALAIGAVVIVALMRGGGSTTASDGTSSTDATTGTSTYDSTANDVYDSIEGQLTEFQQQLGQLQNSLPSSTSTTTGSTTTSTPVQMNGPGGTLPNSADAILAKMQAIGLGTTRRTTTVHANPIIAHLPTINRA